jgi:hypothetical protein
MRELTALGLFFLEWVLLLMGRRFTLRGSTIPTPLRLARNKWFV